MFISPAEAAQAFFAKHPQQGTVDLSASAEPGQLDNVQAMAIKGFAAVNSKLVWVRLKQHVFVNFETQTAGDIIQLPEFDAKYLVNTGKGEIVSDEDVAKAQKATK